MATVGRAASMRHNAPLEPCDFLGSLTELGQCVCGSVNRAFHSEQHNGGSQSQSPPCPVCLSVRTTKTSPHLDRIPDSPLKSLLSTSGHSVRWMTRKSSDARVAPCFLSLFFFFLLPPVGVTTVSACKLCNQILSYQPLRPRLSSAQCARYCVCPTGVGGEWGGGVGVGVGGWIHFTGMHS